MPNDDKKEDHNTGVSDAIKKFFGGKLYQEPNKTYQEPKDGALSRNLIKSIKKCFIKNLFKNLKKVPHHV